MAFFVYRYVDDKTNKIAYIGKTSQSTVRERINQHKTDRIGIWATNNKHHIDFIELPKEEDMNYIESYLIREHMPPWNVVFADVDKKPPFTIQIEETLWKNLEEYEKEQKEGKAKLEEKASLAIQERFLLLEAGEQDFNEKIAHLMHCTPKAIVEDLHYVLSFHDRQSKIKITKQIIMDDWKENTEEKLQERLLNLLQFCIVSRIPGTLTDEKQIRLFAEIKLTEEDVVLQLGEYAPQFINKIYNL